MDRVWREGQKDGALAVFAKILYEHGIDVRDASLENPKVKELAERYGVQGFLAENPKLCEECWRELDGPEKYNELCNRCASELAH